MNKQRRDFSPVGTIQNQRGRDGSVELSYKQTIHSATESSQIYGANYGVAKDYSRIREEN